MKVILYKPAYTSRLQYICDFIFRELMDTAFSITNNVEEFKNSDAIKINYSKTIINEADLYICPVDLLFEQHITPQAIECFEVNNNTAFFKTPGDGFPFDIFAASFYLLSRYEEYLPHEKDMYGRYAHENAIAFKEGFLHLPLINIWVKGLVLALKEKVPTFSVPLKDITFIPTYDIDIAYSYKHKSLVRNVGGFLKSPSFTRLKVLLGLGKDPFDVYDELIALHEKFNLAPVYFFLVAAQNSLYDKNILPASKAMWRLVKKHAKRYTVGIHPSWQSSNVKNLLMKEKEQLQRMSESTITASRQHYIQFNLPEGYRRLMAAGLTDDHSMGYGSINGFRASVASSFFWYDLERDEVTNLRVHPFCYMEANSFYEQKLTAREAFKELMQYHYACKETGSTLITIWHNHLLGRDKLYEGWGEMYRQFLEVCCTKKSEKPFG